MRYIFWFILWLLPLAVLTQNENYIFHQLDIYNGLSNNQVRAILKDKSGFMWFGTISGLNRFDGYSFKLYRNELFNKSSFFNNIVNALFELPDDKMWVSSVDEASIFNFRTEKFENSSSSYLKSLRLPAGTISNIVKGNAGRYWFVYDSLDVYLYSAEDKKVKKIDNEIRLNIHEKIDAVNEASDNMLWIVYHNGLPQEFGIAQNKVDFSSDALQKLNVNNDNYNFIIDNDGDFYGSGIFLMAYFFMTHALI